MIAISRDERADILKLCPSAMIRSTRHRAYLITTDGAVAALSRIRGNKDHVRRGRAFWYPTAKDTTRRQNAL